MRTIFNNTSEVDDCLRKKEILELKAHIEGRKLGLIFTNAKNRCSQPVEKVPFTDEEKMLFHAIQAEQEELVHEAFRLWGLVFDSKYREYGFEMLKKLDLNFIKIANKVLNQHGLGDKYRVRVYEEQDTQNTFVPTAYEIMVKPELKKRFTRDRISLFKSGVIKYISWRTKCTEVDFCKILIDDLQGKIKQ